MSSGMNTEQAKEYAKTMTYTEAVSNIKHAKGIKYRKATMIKIRKLAEIADRLDSKTEPTISKMEQVEDEPQVDGILFKGNLKEGEYKLIKTTDGWVLADEDIVYCGWEMGNE